VYGEVCGSAPRAQRISVRLLVGVHEGLDLVYSRNNRGMLERWKEWKNNFVGAKMNCLSFNKVQTISELMFEYKKETVN
jgi:hypothetical protein